MSKLTPRQKHVLKAILSFTKENKYPPTVRELGKMVGMRSSSTVQRYLEALKLQGLVNWEPSSPRTLTVVGEVEKLEKVTS